MASMGMKAQAKRFLREHGIKEVATDAGWRKLDKAKTIYLVKAASKLGWQNRSILKKSHCDSEAF